MKRQLLITALIASALTLTGCAGLQKQWAADQAAWAKQQAAQRAAAEKAAAARAAKEKKINCSTNGAYANGLNTARTNKTMSPNYATASGCDAKVINAVNASYKQGYQAGVNAPPITKPQPVHHRAKWGCIGNEHSKNICGYHCIKNNWGQVACAKYRHDNCVKNWKGEMACGEHCTVNPDTTLSCQKQTVYVKP